VVGNKEGKVKYEKKKNRRRIIQENPKTKRKQARDVHSSCFLDFTSVFRLIYS